MIYFILSFIYIFIDQLTKFIVASNIQYYSTITINDYINIVHVSNTGIAFSLFQNNNIFFIILTTIIILFLIFLIIKNKKSFTKLQLHSLTLIISGGIGNLIDRLFRSAVVDFIDVGIKDIYRWPAFNVADSCVCIGVTLFIISIFITTSNQKQN